MSQENDVQDQDVDLDKDLDDNAGDDSNDNQGDDNESDDTTDWKAEAQRLKGINKRYETKLAKRREDKTEVKPKGQKSSEMDYGEKGKRRNESC
jgi:hypothetical protein